ncbi:MAG: CRTAC1 family protein [Bryobacteraceae bacterium]|nr:CRTAC1 family protein [Bryobacteraceae bacterium]
MPLLFFLAALACFAQSGMTGSATSGRAAQPARPLPKGRTAPRVDLQDLAAQAGLTAINVSGDPQHNSYIVETTGNGLALFDYDGDGLVDIFLVNAGQLDAKAAPRGARHHLYRNLGGLKFADVTDKALIPSTSFGQGVCAGDYDNDGRLDLVIANWGPNTLLHNEGNGTFTDQSAKLPQGKTRWTTGCAFLDYDRDGDLDLFLAHYLDFNPATTPKPGAKSQCVWKGLPVACGPRGLPGESMSLLRNDGGGKFTDVSKAAGISTAKNYYGFTVLTGDFDNDGWPDVYVACDSTASLLFHNLKNGTFAEEGIVSGAALNEDGREQAGMGAAAGDYDGDGKLDIFKTNFSDDTPTLYRNLGGMAFADVTVRAGLGIHTKFLGWGAAFLDVDQDGWKDILHVNGHVYPEVDTAGIKEQFAQERTLYWNRGDGEFYDLSHQAGSAVTERHASRGMATADLDNDGTLEVVIVNLHQPPSLWKNRAPVGNALLVEARLANGRDAIGAKVMLTANGRTMVDEVRSGGFHISHGDLRTHFGLGTATKARLSIRWPDGTTKDYGEVSANQWVTARQNTGLSQRPFAK